MPNNKTITTPKPLTTEEFDTASNHPWTCKCDLCQRWHEEVGEEDDGGWEEIA